MTKHEHAVLHRWMGEVLEKLQVARDDLFPDAKKVLMRAAGEQMKFLGDNLKGGCIVLEDGRKINTGEFLVRQGDLTIQGLPDEEVDKLIEIMVAMIARHAQHMAQLPDTN